MIASQDFGSSRADLFRGFELALGNAAFQFSSLVRTRSIDLTRWLRSKARRSSECTTNTRTPGSFELTSCTSVWAAATSRGP